MLSSVDSITTHWINGLAGQIQGFDLFMIAVTTIGAPLMVLAVAVQWWPRAGRQSERHVLIACGLSFLLGLALNQIALLFIHRIRPYDAGVTHLLIAPSHDPSFPSDHATAAFAIVFAYLVNHRSLKATLFFAAAMLLVVSRVYVGTHYVGDIIGGVFSALLASVFVKGVYAEGTALDRRITRLL